MRIIHYLLGFCLLLGLVLANPVSEDEDGEEISMSSEVQNSPILDKIGEKHMLDEHEENQISSEADEAEPEDNENDLPGMRYSSTSAPEPERKWTETPLSGGYDSRPTQSPFVDDLPHPTQSYRPDPRFAVQPRVCAEDQYLCEKATPSQEHVRCIPNSWKCNGVRDCENNDDERDCGSNSQTQNTYFQSCRSDEYTCHVTNLCIRQNQKCDGQNDCAYGDDEVNCPGGDDYRRRRPEPARAPEQNSYDFRQVSEIDRDRSSEQPTYQQTYPNNYIHRQQAQSYPQRTECPKPEYDEEEVKKYIWVNRCMKTCMSKYPSI